MKPWRISDSCQAGCSHCPFGKAKKHYQTVEDVRQKLSHYDGAEQVVLSGGEPLEHPEMRQILQLFLEKEVFFRIATGGHVPLSAFLPVFRRSKYFTGFSLGTDVLLPSRNENAELYKNWVNNLKLLNAWKMPYSLTFTVGNDIERNIWNQLRELFSISKPNFLMFNTLNEYCLDLESDAHIMQIRDIFGADMPVKYAK